MKADIFNEEINLIQNEEVKAFVREALEIVPDYFFAVPASSTGKYHPSYALGEGGLVRHTKAAVRIAYELFRMDDWSFEPIKQDLIITSLLLHDGWKNGLVDEHFTGFTITKHPLVASEELQKNFSGKVSQNMLKFVCDGIETHMGQWTTDWRSKKKILKKPKTKEQKLIHLADYLASRKCIEMNFNAELSQS